MPHYRRVGAVPPKRHRVARDGDGTRLHEELVGQAGFSSRSALLYHRRSPSAVVAIEAVADTSALATVDSPLTPRHLRTGQLVAASDLVTGRQVVLANDAVRIGFAAAAATSPLYRNAVGDELVYVQSGTATLESVFGALPVGPGDYVVVPAGITHRWCHTEPLRALIVEARGHVGPPARYLSTNGQFLEHAPYCERDLRAPDTPLVISDDGTSSDGTSSDGTGVLVRTGGGLSRHTHRHHPFDVVGWDGSLYPWAFNIADFEPIVGSAHQPPPIHQTFEGPGFVICSFVPRPLDFGPDAVKVPYYHSNTDSDEVLFYSAGSFTSRAGSGVGVGSITFHPAGFVHGPQPGSYEASVDEVRTDELAVMIDTFAPLRVTDVARHISAPEYPFTWARDQPGT